MRVELHCHSTCSDGSLTPEALGQRAADRGVRLFCLTDHDTLAGSERANAVVSEAHCLRGLELSCKAANKTVHLLMYGVQPGPGELALRARLDHIDAQRRERIEQILDKLEALGVHLDRNAIRAKGHGRTPGRPDVAAALVEAGVCNSMRQAFDQYLKDDGPAYVAVDRVSLEEGLALGRACGAKMSLAHPHTLRNFALVEDLFVRHKAEGLEGIEARYGKYAQAEIEHWSRLAVARDLVVTGGSDFHGWTTAHDAEPGIELPEPVAKRLFEWLQCPWPAEA